MKIVGFVKQYGMTILVVAAVLYLSLSESPVEEPPFTFPYLDKIVHFCMYGGLVFIFGVDIYRSDMDERKANRLLNAAWWVAVCLGGCMELAQALFTAARTADRFDFLANMLGASAGYLFVRFVWKIVWRRYFSK